MTITKKCMELMERFIENLIDMDIAKDLLLFTNIIII